MTILTMNTRAAARAPRSWLTFSSWRADSATTARPLRNRGPDTGALAGDERGVRRSADGAQIARRLGVSRQSVQRIADLLVAEGWATFEANPDHRGSPYLVLNKRGSAALAKLTAAAAAYHTRLAQHLAATDAVPSTAACAASSTR